jgi:hypothetical protein
MCCNAIAKFAISISILAEACPIVVGISKLTQTSEKIQKMPQNAKYLRNIAKHVGQQLDRVRLE